MIGTQTVDDVLAAKADALCHVLGYKGTATFFDRLASFDRAENLNVVATAFDTIGIHSVFGLSDGAVAGSFKPAVFVGTARSVDEAVKLHRLVWTQGVVPLLIVVTPDLVEIRNALGSPHGKPITVAFTPGSGPLDEALVNVSARSLTSSIFWKDRAISRSESIDTRLVDAIEDLNRDSCARHGTLDTQAGRALVNALIGRLIYLYVLIDRGIVDSTWMHAAISAAGCDGDSFPEAAIRREVRVNHSTFLAGEVWAVLDAVDAAINGSIFPISSIERLTIPDDLVLRVHRVVRWGEQVNSRQISFLDVSFEVLRTETISAIYERFLRIEDGVAQRAEGAFYTPPYLADFLINRIEKERHLDAEARVIDAAAGSGVFLVSAYRKIMECCSPQGGWKLEELGKARHLLRSCIFGIEKNRQAANVCRFSLYLTMLDYFPKLKIGRVSGFDDGQKLLPPLDENIIVGNAFSHPFDGRTFTHVVGNPPWVRLNRRGSQRNVFAPRGAEVTDGTEEAEADPVLDAFLAGLNRRTPTVQGRLSDAFVWLAAEHLLAEDGVLGMVLPTTSLVGRQSNRFSSALASRMSVRLVANLSYLRYRLFKGARAPATVVLARKRLPSPLDTVAVSRPRLSSLPLGRHSDVWALLVAQTDLQMVRCRELQGDDNGWLGPLMHGALDRRMRSALQTWSRSRERTVADFFRRSGLRIMRGGNETDTGFRFSRKIDERGQSKPVNLVLLLEGPGPEVKEDYRPLFSGNVLLVPRSFKDLRVLPEPHAFNSTYYAIAPADRWTRRDGSHPSTPPEPEVELARLGNLLAFLTSGVVRYFSALYGATVLMDGARFESGDILAMPCPFEDAEDPSFQALSRSSDVDGGILDALGAGADLRRAVSDFVDFSEGYADAQLPPLAFDEVKAETAKAYFERFRRELAGSFTERHAPSVVVGDTEDGVVSLRVSFESGREDGVRRPADGAFVAASVVSYDRERRVGHVRKTAARFAWTVDQAVEDAEALVRLVATSNT